MKNILLLTLILIAQQSFAQSIEVSQSQVDFEISNMKFNTVKGSFTGMQGTIVFDETDLSLCQFEVCVDASTVNTGSSKRDKHLLNEDFFDVATYPTICISSQQISKSAMGYELVGDLKMHGITKPIKIPFQYENATFTGTFQVNRFDFGVGEKTSKFMVGETVDITIVCKINP